MARKEIGFTERLQTTISAKKARLEKIRLRKQAGEAQSDGRKAERMATEEARRNRKAERESAKRTSTERRNAEYAAEKARRHALTQIKRQSKTPREMPRWRPDAALKSSQKAARDATYAARKGRQS